MSNMIDTARIAEMMGVSREYVTDRVTKRPDFPPPALDLSRKTRRWRESDVTLWLERQSKRAAMSSGLTR